MEEVQFYYFLTCGTGEINWSAAQSCPFVLRETVPGMHRTRSRSAGAGLEEGRKERVFVFGRNIGPPPTRRVSGRPARNAVTILTELLLHISKSY